MRKGSYFVQRKAFRTSLLDCPTTTFPTQRDYGVLVYQRTLNELLEKKSTRRFDEVGLPPFLETSTGRPRVQRRTHTRRRALDCDNGTSVRTHITLSFILSESMTPTTFMSGWAWVMFKQLPNTHSPWQRWVWMAASLRRPLG